VAIPLFVLNEWFHPLPLMRLQMLGRRNLAYGVTALVIFLIVGQGATTVPMQVLQDVLGYRPLQWGMIMLGMALAQIVLLPLMAFVLDFPQVDARVVSFVGLALILTACIGSSYVNIVWNRDQFIFWQALQAVGQSMVIMPLLLMATNSIKGPGEAPFASALFNTPRAIAEVVAVWLFALIDHWRGALHSDRIVDQIGQNRFSLVQSNGVLPNMPTALLPDGQPRAPGSLRALSATVHQQVTLMSAADTFLVLGAMTVFLMIVLLVLPVRTLPPRIQLAKQ
jgi:MFS transporter, DHA2 family, multidrug resistance protein